MLILPGSNDFIETISALTIIGANNSNGIIIVRPGNFGLPEKVSLKEAQEFFLDGELEERTIEMNEYNY